MIPPIVFVCKVCADHCYFAPNPELYSQRDLEWGDRCILDEGLEAEWEMCKGDRNLKVPEPVTFNDLMRSKCEGCGEIPYCMFAGRTVPMDMTECPLGLRECMDWYITNVGPTFGNDFNDVWGEGDEENDEDDD